MRERGAVLLLCLAQFVDVLGVTIAVVGLPEIGRGLGAPGAATQWVVSGYALLFGGFLIPAGRLGDRFGHRRSFLAGVAAFAVASLAAGLAPTLLVVLLARAAQGLAAAFVVPSAFALVLALTEEGPERVKAVGWWTATAAAGGAAGFLCGGVLVQSLGWRAMFLVNVPICVLVLALAPSRLAGRGGDGGRRAPLDLPGAVLVTGALLAGIAALSGVVPVVLAPSALLLLGMFAVVELRSANPLLPGRLVRSARFCSALAAAFALTCATTPASVVATAFFQTAQGLPAGLTGVLFAPFSVGVVVGSAAASRLLSRWGARLCAGIGFGIVVAALLVGAAAVAAGSTALFTASLALSGAGLGGASVAATHAGTEVVGDEHRGIASGLLNTAPQLGSAIGTAVIGVVALSSDPPKLLAGMLVAAGVAVAGTLAVAGLRDRVAKVTDVRS
ncbi:MFS transporter [Amycolatopsis australiensis]|uniref:Predicted arabinose efflux permease, MFS family n=1 Tax=Amycolatopsis australiensis TaxID=546364 RepID=A0A1K1SAQ1_9PSEU|nr:MFS transporter [Amycolatopsis australiensis]SFW81440.1 Predicted arabinose efflux permease, MFS family [Amycolatopsis australiensis]